MRSALPWLTLSAIIWLQAIAGTNTDFPAYSSELKSRLGITQLKLNNLAMASDAGKLLGWCAGAAAIRLPIWSVLIVGAALGVIGYGVQFLFASNIISSLSYTQFVFLNMLNGNSICWLNTAGYTAIRRQFLVEDHGAVIGLTTSYTGLTGAIYLAVTNVIVGKRDGKSIYLLLNAVTPVVVGLIATPTLVMMRPQPTDVRAGFLMMFSIANITGAYAVIKATVPAMRNSSGEMTEAVLLLLVLAVVLVPVLKAGEQWRAGRGIETTRVAKAEELGEDKDVEEAKEEPVTSGAVDGAAEGESVKTVWELVWRVNFWVYFMAYLFGATLGLVYGNNLGQISESRGVPENILLSIYSSFGFFGRLATAPLSAFSRSKCKISKTGTVAVLMVAMTAAFFLLVTSSSAALFAGTAIISLCSGAITSIAVSVTSELFGQERFSVNHNIVIANIPIGSFIFGSIAAVVYDHGDGVRERNGVCIGVDCYLKTFIIWGGICTLGTILSFLLYYRTRKSS